MTWTETWDLKPVYTDPPPEPKKQVEDECLKKGSIIGCENRSLGEVVGVAGTPYRLHYQSDRKPGTTGANAIVVAHAADLGGWTLNVHHRYDPNNNILYLGSGAFRSAESLGTVTPSVSSGYLIASADGRQVYEFNANGIHTRTLNALTGATMLTFAYAPDPLHGWLLSVTDGDGNETTFNRSASAATLGRLVSITAPRGQISKVTLDKQGYLTSLKDPAGKTVKAKYTQIGLLTAYTDARGMTSSFTYDTAGRLISDKNAAGGSQTLASNTTGDTVTHITKVSPTTSYQTTYQTVNNTDGSTDRTITLPNGLQNTSHKTAALAQNVTLGDGTQIATTPVADARFGNSASIPQTTITTPGGLVNSITSSRTPTLASADPLNLASQTETLTLNGKTFTRSFDAASSTINDTTPLGRQTTYSMDGQGRTTGVQIAGLNAAASYAYDNKGRLTTINVGSGNDTRTTTFAYDATSGDLVSITDPLGRTLGYTRDKLGRTTQQTLPDGSTIKFAYDAEGNLTKLTNAANKAYGFTYGKTGLLTSFTLPAAKGAKTKESYTYNPANQLTGMTRLDGTKLAYGYDSAGRLSTITATGTQPKTWTNAYDASGHLGSITEPGGISLNLTHDGELLQTLAWTNLIANQPQSVGFIHNNDFQVASISINGANPIAYTYDNDGLLTAAGALTLQRSAQNTLRTGSTLNDITDSYTRNAFGEVSHYAASSATTGALLAVDYTYDKLGRITQRTETIQGDTKTYNYTYDVMGRLDTATDGTTTTTYTYDKNGNRTGANTTGGTSPISTSGTYDAQDRLLTYGDIKYAYNKNGEVSSRTQGSATQGAQGSQTTQYEYNALGYLVAAVLADGTCIDYVVDGTGMRIGRKVGGTLQQAFLYQDSLKPVAELDGAGNIVSRFVYATRVNVPDYMIKDGTTYRIITDHLGSPRLVVNTATGAIAQRMDYDEFGNVLQDTSPGFQPFGFAGGLYDQHTKLVHYGAREYDPKTGRWMARDPIGFTGGSMNLYANLNDPVNTVDPSGWAWYWWSNIKATVSNYIQSKFSSVKAGPVTISTDAPKVSIGGSQEVTAGDTTLVEVSAEASVEVLTSGGAADDLLKGTVSVGVKQPFLAKLPIIGAFFCEKKIEAEATVKINPELVDRMNTNLNRAWQAQQEN